MSSAVVVMPRGLDAWATAEALWVTAKGWASAARRRFGAAWIATPDGSWESHRLPARSSGGSRVRRRYPVPILIRTLMKDVRLWRRQSRFDLPLDGPWRESGVDLVWEHHDLFNQGGQRLALATGAPLVRYVHAPQVWEARKWGVQRPVWGSFLERLELRHLQAADVVACVSVGVRDRLREMGVDPAHLVIAPMGFDPDHFPSEGANARRELSLGEGTVVVGWCGSFRPFHGLELLLEAFSAAARKHSQLHLLLIGDGSTRPSVERAARAAGIDERVTFTGFIDHAEIPYYLRAIDIAVVSSEGREGFHYSPLKLREYAASGCPVVAPAEGELRELEECEFMNLYQPGSHSGLARAFERLAENADLRGRQGGAARAFALKNWTWTAQLERVLTHIGGLSQRGAFAARACTGLPPDRCR